MTPADEQELGHGGEFAVRWRNFRAFRDTGWVPLKPLTLLLGSNSAGKSSFIAPLLLLKQSLLSRTGRNALLTRGEYLDVGVYTDFVRDHDAGAEVQMGLRWHSHPPRPKLPKPGRFAPGGAEFRFRQGSDPQSVDLSAYRVEDIYQRTMLSRTARDDGTYSTRLATPPPSSRRSKRLTKAEVAARTAMRQALRDARPVDFLFSSTQVRLAGAEARLEGDAPSFSTTIDDERVRFYCSVTDHTEWSIRDLLDNLHYIGPLREAPRRVYSLSGEMPAEVGTRGEYAPEIVYRWRRSRARMREVRRWLAHFGFDEELDFQEVGSGGFSLMLNRDGAPVASTFVDTGFGMSQVLPLIAQGLMAKKGDWLIVEQPEIHLNPRLQAALADLFADIVRRGIGLVIESHSEHLLLRLRRLVAQEKLEADSVGLYFVEQTEGRSTVREVPIEAGGFVRSESWPKGFFEDSLREAMSLAQAQARHKRRATLRTKRRSRDAVAKGEREGA